MPTYNLRLEHQNISYGLRLSRRARYMRATIDRGGELTVTVPPWLNNREFVEKFLASKQKWILKTLDKVQKAGGRKSFLPKSSRRDYLARKHQSLLLAKSKIDQLNRHYRFSYRNISVKNQKSRWGSCSRRGNLNFNYRIIFLPEPLLNYLIAHELCHLKEFNHSKNFWSLVAETVPDYRTLRKQLKLL